MSTIFSQRTSEAIIRALVRQYNALHQATIATSTAGFHRDISGVPAGDFRFPTSSNLQVSAANSTDLPTVLVLAKNLQGVLQVHLADDEAHLIADAVNVGANALLIDNTSGATQLSSVIIMLNAIKVAFNAHLTQSGVHLNNDGTNSVATANATDLATSITLANAMKTKVNTHIVSGPAVGRIKLQ
jgi:hypothetical protein